ncbi:MAG: cytochrome c biogenesis protein ResB [Oscillospiraceae bacterium]|nr:cytochrome c biogenesis protein ResB [Oscillospiraceae bacterium]
MMKKVFGFLRSMRFGMILLTLIAILCIAATALGNETIYRSWYFIALFAMLSINLMFCSVLRAFSLKKQKKALAQRAIQAEAVLPVKEASQWLETHHFRVEGDVAFRNTSGFLGPFLTHFAMLLLILSAACIFLLAQTQDLILFPKENTELPDGTVLYLESFQLEDETGETDYCSSLSALLPDGTETGGETTVNHPLKVGRYKIYQQDYGYAAVIGLKTEKNAEEELIWLEEPAFLSLDGESGVYYSQIFSNVKEENGEVMVSRSGDMINPAYEIQIVDGEGNRTSLVYPGTVIDVGGITFSFKDPGVYPGMRVKTQPEWTLWMLYLSFALMLLGLYLCFFMIPEAAHIKPDGLSIIGRKDISDRIDRYQDELEMGSSK